jgi:hypothetical protein
MLTTAFEFFQAIPEPILIVQDHFDEEAGKQKEPDLCIKLSFVGKALQKSNLFLKDLESITNF